MTQARRRPRRLFVALALVLSAVVALSSTVAAIGLLEAIVVRAAIQTIGLKQQEKHDRRAVNARRDRRLAEVAASEAALAVKAERGWLTPERVELERRRLDELRTAYTETALRERQIVSYQTRRRIDARFQATLTDALKVATGADPRAVDFVVDLLRGHNPLEAAIDAAFGSAGVADPREPFVALRDQLREIDRTVSALGGADTIAIRARLQQALREATGLAAGDGEPPDDKLARLRDISDQLGEAAARLGDIRDDLFPGSPGIATERFAGDERWLTWTAAIERLDSTEAKQRLVSAIWRRSVDRAAAIAAAAGLEPTAEEVAALARAVAAAWVDARLEGGLVPGQAIDIDDLVRVAIDESRALAGQDSLFPDAGPGPDCGDAIGSWQWFNGIEVSISSDGSFSSPAGTAGTWRCTSDDTVELTWQDGGWLDTLTISPDGASMSGGNQSGNIVSATRNAPADAVGEEVLGSCSDEGATIIYWLIDPPPYSGSSPVCRGPSGQTWIEAGQPPVKVQAISEGTRDPETGCRWGSSIVTETRTFEGTLCGT